MTETYFILIQPWAVYVKEAEFFRSQGGERDDWGKHWLGPIEAESIEGAREKGTRLRDRLLNDKPALMPPDLASNAEDLRKSLKSPHDIEQIPEPFQTRSSVRDRVYSRARELAAADPPYHGEDPWTATFEALIEELEQLQGKRDDDDDDRS